MAVSGLSQSLWTSSFSAEKGKKLREAYEVLKNGRDQKIELPVLKKYVKTLNDFALLHLDELNEEFQKTALKYVISTDSLQYYKNKPDFDWWKAQFLRIAEILPIFEIQKKVSRLEKPVDTLQIKVPGTDRTILAVVNHKVIKQYILSTSKQRLVSDMDLRNLTTNEVTDIITYYRTGELPLDKSQQREKETAAASSLSDSIQKDTLAAPVASANTSVQEVASQSSDREPNTTASSQKEAPSETAQYQEPPERKELAQDEPVSSNSQNRSATSQGQTNAVSASTKGVAYRVQIAASHQPLSAQDLRARYTGDRSQKTFREGGWLKYYVAETASLQKARRILNEPEMPADAFIMAYRNGQKTPELLKEKFSSDNKDFIDLAPKTYNKKVWVVQIAAHQTPLSLSEVRARYTGNKAIYHIKEGVWHRYSIGIFNSFDKANTMRKECGVPDAFVAVYSEGHRLDIWSGTPRQLPDKPVKYLVQIAAARKPLTREQLNKRYSGKREVINFQENGYYKYALGRFDTYAKAQQIKNNCGVFDAFIKAYQGKKKISIHRAKQNTDIN